MPHLIPSPLWVLPLHCLKHASTYIVVGSVMNRQHCERKEDRLSGLVGFIVITFHCCNNHCDQDNLQKAAFTWGDGFGVLRTHDEEQRQGAGPAESLSPDSQAGGRES